MIKHITAKSILSPLKNGPDPWFGISYNMNLYRGCQHQCIYCDSRSECYQIENFADIMIKENAIQLLTKQLRGKRKKGTIGTGSMNDPYMPIEARTCLTQQALKTILHFRFPLHILTKSDLVLRDEKLIKEIGRIYSAVSFTITTADDQLSKIIEPGAPESSRRFRAIRELSLQGIYTGILLMPVLPFITDHKENIEAVVRKGKEAGAKYIVTAMGMTNRTGQREYYFNKLDKHFPGIKQKYIDRFGDDYNCPLEYHKELYSHFKRLCAENDMPVKMKFFEDVRNEQMKLF
ncbi:MAG: radical SAM protein [Bacteroidales bacterium]|nr:radical SAM protein [Bacteroidales bacterium]MCF8456155.1 radical SAM protein [Bacteroidales bacterium]